MSDTVRIRVRYHGRTYWAIVDRADDERLGLSQRRWSLSDGYATNRDVGLMHRAVLGLPKGVCFCHHINEEKLDNRRANLEVYATRSLANMQPHPKARETARVAYEEYVARRANA